MTQDQWEQLLAIIQGETLSPLPVGFIIDSPWLPHWHGASLLDYFSDNACWLQANLSAVNAFPQVLFLPGFWAEYGMCSEPASFGAKCSFYENEFPFAHPLADTLDNIHLPDPRKDGLTPFLLRRLERMRPGIEAAGHAVRFAVARGPLNIASFLMGATEFLMALRMEPEKVHRLLDTITAFLVDWLRLQRDHIDTIDGILLLDDIVGFLGEEDFKEFARPYVTQAFAAFDASVRFFHNDAHGLICAPFLSEMGINLFNFGHAHFMTEMRHLAGHNVTLLGNIPPRDVLAQGSPAEVEASVREVLEGLEDTHRVILSCGGGMAPGVPTENIEAFLRAAKSL